MNEKLIQVLWVEDDPLVTGTYPIEAARYGLELVPFACWKDAEKALESDFNKVKSTFEDSDQIVYNSYNNIDSLIN